MCVWWQFDCSRSGGLCVRCARFESFSHSHTSCDVCGKWLPVGIGGNSALCAACRYFVTSFQAIDLIILVVFSPSPLSWALLQLFANVTTSMETRARLCGAEEKKRQNAFTSKRPFIHYNESNYLLVRINSLSFDRISHEMNLSAAARHQAPPHQSVFRHSIVWSVIMRYLRIYDNFVSP